MRVLITGASSGIGAAAARLLASRGADVALVARGARGLARTAGAVQAQGRRAVVVPADVADADAVQSAVDEAAEQLGGLDGVIVNAGVAAYGRFTDTPRENVDRTIDVTLNGAIHTIRAALPHLEKTAGTLVITGSVASKLPLPLMASYTAAKHGLRGFVDALRIELKAQGSSVRIAMVHPGPVDSPFWNNATPSGPAPPDFPRAYTPERVAEALADALVQPRAHRTVGPSMLAGQVLRAIARPVFDLGLVQAARWAFSHPADREPGTALWEPSGDARLDGGINDEERFVEAAK